MLVTAEQSSQEILDTIPLVMRTIRAEMRRQRKADLSVPQFRTLAFLQHSRGASLSEVAEHLGLTLPSMSKQIDGLVERRLVLRKESVEDRRRVTLSLTTSGATTFAVTRAAAQSYIAEMLRPLSDDDQDAVVRAMQLLRSVFGAALVSTEVEA